MKVEFITEDSRDRRFFGDAPPLRRMLNRSTQWAWTRAEREEAIEKIALKPYDIVMCDYNLGAGKTASRCWRKTA